MSESWANYGIDLHLDLGEQGGENGRGERGRGGRGQRGERGPSGPPAPRVRAGLEAGLRDAVRSGRLAPGTRLPSSRALAADLQIARNTVADAYSQLVAEGWLTSRTGAGTWVADRPVVVPPARAQAVSPAGPPRYDLRAGVPAVAAFPRRQWLAAVRSGLSSAPDNVLDYPDSRGLAELRAALAGYLARVRGVVTSPDQVVICAGFSHALAIIARVIAARGGTAIAVEAYGHRAHRSILTAHGLAVAPLRVDASGAVPSEAVLGNAAAVMLTPAHQFPLGMTLAPRRRTAFADWAARTGGLVIEDDYDGEFRYDRQPVGALQALAPEHMVYAGTASKSLAPGVRLGWLAVPAGMVDEVDAAKEDAGAHSGVLDQLALAKLINSGAYDRQIRQTRLNYSRRRDRLVSALAVHAPRVRLTGIAAGLNALAVLPDGCGEDEAVSCAARHGVVVEGLGGYAADRMSGSAVGGPADLSALVVGYGRPADHAFSTAVGRLCAALAEVT
jgi:GntR family transcriptional regulator / MocR family aminotransferase